MILKTFKNLPQVSDVAHRSLIIYITLIYYIIHFTVLSFVILNDSRVIEKFSTESTDECITPSTKLGIKHPVVEGIQIFFQIKSHALPQGEIIANL